MQGAFLNSECLVHIDQSNLDSTIKIPIVLTFISVLFHCNI